MNERGISKNEVVSLLTRSPHGKLQEYVPVGQAAAKQDGEFFAHLVSWNMLNGQIRDAKVALPVINLSVGISHGVGILHSDFRDNALAHMAMLDPRNLLRALRFSREIKTPGSGMAIRRMVEAYLRARESNWAKWERAAVQHRVSMKELYALYRVKPSTMADTILFKGQYPKGTVFEAIANLRHMTASEAAGNILERKIPFLIAVGALGEKAKDPALVLAMIDRMTPAELVNNTKMLERLGINTVPELRAAYAAAIAKASESKNVATFKATTAAEAIEDEGLRDKLRDMQEKVIKRDAGIEGNWLVLADKSGSMSEAIEVSRHVAGTLAAMVKGKVHLVFFDTAPRYMDVTGKTYEQIKEMTKHVMAQGGTSMGCGLLAIAEKKLDIDGIAVVSDGGENNPPWFRDTYKAYSQAIGKEVPVYLYRTAGEMDAFSRLQSSAGIDVQKFDLSGGKVDYYALPNLVRTMKIQRYGLVEQIMDTPLLRLEDVLGKVANNTRKEGEKIHA